MIKDKENILVIGPLFFNYAEEITEELNRNGFNAILKNERVGDSFKEKVIVRLRLQRFLKNKINRHVNNIKQCIIDNSIERVIVLNPETLDAKVLQEISDLVLGRITVYLWDSFRNKKNFKSIVKQLGNKVITFDPSDAEQYSIAYFPLFYTKQYRIVGTPKVYDLCSVCTMHSKRIIILSKILAVSNKTNLKCRFHLYYSSYAQLIMKTVRHPISVFMLRKYLTNKKIDHSEINAIFNSSKVVIDITHPKQTGLTSRTFEALGAGANLITTNNWISKHPDLTVNTEVFSVSDIINIPDYISALQEDNKSQDAVIKYRIDNWVLGLLELGND